MAKTRCGMGKGKGKGWKNIMPDDSRRHSLARKGVKTALSPRLKKAVKRRPSLVNKNFGQLKSKGVFLRYQGDADKDGVVNIRDCRPLDPKKQDLKEELKKFKEKAVPVLKKVAVKTKELAVKGAKEAKVLAEKGYQRYQEYQEEKKEEALREIEHPLMKKLDTQKSRIEELKTKVISEDDKRKQEKLKRELDLEQEQLRQIQKRVTEIKKAGGKEAKVLAEVEHPLMKKLDTQKSRVEELEKQVITEDDKREQEKLNRELDREQEQLRQIQERITEIKTADLSNDELRKLAINYEDDSIFSIFSDSGNKYERELLRRIRKEAELARSEKEIKTREEAETARLNQRLKEEKKRIIERGW